MNDNKIKILYLIDTFDVGGAERLLLDLCSLIDKQQFDVHVCTVVKNGPLYKEFKENNIPVTIFRKKTKLGVGVIIDLYRFIKEYKPDIVHTNLFGSDVWGKIATILARVPYIVTTEHSTNLKEGYIRKKVKQILSYFTTQIIAVSDSVRDTSIFSGKINPEKIKVVYNGISLKKFGFRGYKSINLNKRINAVIIARLVEPKGHKFLINALPMILEKYPNFYLNIIGDGKLEKKLTNQVKKLGISKSVKFWGRRLDVASILPEMDLFILPSIWEGLGIVLIEAQSVGLPVITSDIPGSNEVVIDKKTGLLFKSKNPQMIYEKVDELLKKPELVRIIVANAYKQVNSKFDIKKMVDKYSLIYKQILKK